jgi:hypothetical protein
MALTVDEYISAFYPKLSLSPSYYVYVESATDLVDPGVFGKHTNRAIALRACHDFYLDTDRKGQDGGAITGKSDGRISLRFFNKAEKASASGLELSIYGLRLRALTRSLGLGASIGNPDIPLGA